MKICGKEIPSQYASLVTTFVNAANFEKRVTSEGKEYYSLSKESYIILLTIARLTELTEDKNKNNQA